MRRGQTAAEAVKRKVSLPLIVADNDQNLIGGKSSSRAAVPDHSWSGIDLDIES